LKTLLDFQDKRVKKVYPFAKFDYKEEKIREEPVILRTGDISEYYDGPEYTIFIDFGEFILFLVLLCPKDKTDDYLKKLKWTAEKLIPGKFVSDLSGKPILIHKLKN
jgi:hypothetical protein